jgi:hypothetical protein
MWLNVFAILGGGLILGSLYLTTVLREFGAQPASQLAPGDRTPERDASSHPGAPPMH